MNTTPEPMALVSAATGQDSTCSAFYSNAVLYDRGFEIRHLTPGWAGPVVPDESRPELFRTADLVLLNFSKNLEHARKHHDLCLALERPPQNTLLISPGKRPIKIHSPYTTINFCNALHLMHKLRKFFAISNPLAPSDYGYSMVFRAPSPFFALSDLFLPQALVSTLRELRFSGRCECYSNTRKIFDRPDYILALGIRERAANLHLDGKWWKCLEETLCAALAAQNAGVFLVPNLSEFVEMETIGLVNSRDGTAEFQDGRPSRLCYPQRASTWFERLVLAELDGQLPPIPRR